MAVHLLFWAVNFYLILHQYTEHSRGIHMWLFVPVSLIIISFQAICVYAIAWFLVPRVRKQQYILFILGIIVFIIIASGLEVLVTDLYSVMTRGRRMPMRLFAWISTAIEMLPVCIFFTGFILFYDFYKQNERNRLLEKERLETELQFLKGQVNPHFMFNALNSIYILMRLRRDIAEETIMRFSSLLRYTLYECSEPAVLLEKEITFLEDYIALEKLRHADLDIDFRKEGKTYSKRIAPFLLMPFLENAFKHVSHAESQKNFIHIDIQLQSNELRFYCCNSCAWENGNHIPGIGLGNIKRRLALIYPGKHELLINQEKNIFTSTLVLYDIKNDLPDN